MPNQNSAPGSAKTAPADEGGVDFLAVFLCGLTGLFIALAFFLS